MRGTLLFAVCTVALGSHRLGTKRRAHHKKSLVVESCPCGSGNQSVHMSDCGCGDTVTGVLPISGRALSDESVPPLDVTPTTTPTPGTTLYKITDQTLLTVYKGHDESDRDGVADYGDLIHDFRQGWNLWPSTPEGPTEIKYVIDDTVGNCERSTLTVAMSVIAHNSCIKFSQLSQSVYLSSGAADPVIHITNRPGGCFASLGFRPGPSENLVNIGPGCVNVGTVTHLVLHALGLFHEHQRPDRDTFVKLVTTNIDGDRVGGNKGTTKYDVLFGKAGPGQSLWVNATESKPYDYSSIMHNGPCHYSVSEEFGGGNAGCSLEPSLVANPPSNLKSPSPATKYWGSPSDIGNRATLSPGDVSLLSLLYPCSGSSSVANWPTGTSSVPSVAIPASGSTTNTIDTEEQVDEEMPEPPPPELPANSTDWVNEVDNSTSPSELAKANDNNFWPAEPVPVSLVLMGVELPPYTPDPADAVTPETTLCTTNDAASFEWSEKAKKGNANRSIMRAVSTKSGDSVTTTALPTLNPNEQLVFKSFFKEAISTRMMYVSIGAIVLLATLAGIAIFFIQRQKKMRSRGLKAAVETGQPGPSTGGDQVPLLSTHVTETDGPKDTGDSTDSEVYADIIDDDNFGTLPSSQQVVSGQVPASGSAARPAEGLV